jgi:filamentous hemagglutinin family protein
MKKMQTSNFSLNLRRMHNRIRRRFRRVQEVALNCVKATSMTLGLFVFALGSPGQAWAANLPSGATVVHGTVDLQQQGNDALRILQGSQSAIVNWQSFDIGAGALVDIVQPNIDSALLSRIVGGNPSEILGSLNANGHLFLVNPNGIVFGKDSTVDVHALIASTLDIADSAFLSGNISFTGDSEAAVFNLGSINAESFAALIGGDVSNTGSITSRGGDAALLAADAILEVGEASGGKITLDISGLLGGTAGNSGLIDVASSTM